MIRFKPSGMNRAESDQFVEEKDLAFVDIIGVNKLEPDFINQS